MTQNEFKEFDNPNKFGCSAKSIIRYFEYTKQLEGEEIYDIYHTWNIPKRKSKFLLTFTLRNKAYICRNQRRFSIRGEFTVDRI